MKGATHKMEETKTSGAAAENKELTECKESKASEGVERRLSEADRFYEELSALIGKHRLDERYGTPDFVLAGYLCSCLRAYGEATKRRAPFCHGVRGRCGI